MKLLWIFLITIGLIGLVAGILLFLEPSEDSILFNAFGFLAGMQSNDLIQEHSELTIDISYTPTTKTVCTIIPTTYENCEDNYCADLDKYENGTEYCKDLRKNYCRNNTIYTNKCSKELYSGTTFVNEDNNWVKMEDARSLKGSGIKCVINSDGENLAECKDWWYNKTLGSYQIELETSQKTAEISSKDVPIRILKYNEEVSKINHTYSSLSNKQTDIITLDYGDIIHFGEESTTIQLQDADTENLDDANIDSGNPNDNTGSSTQISMRHATVPLGAPERILLRFNISSIPTNANIENSTLSVYKYSDVTGNIGVGVHHIYSNFSWNESTITWNLRPNESIEYNTTSNENITFIRYSNRFYNFDVTDILKNEESENISFYLIPNSGDGEHIIYSKEYTTDTSKRPYMNLTYNITYGETPPDTTDTIVTLNSPDVDASLDTNPITFNCTASDNINLTNVTLYIDGVANETNSSGVNNSNYIFSKNISDGNHNWTCEAFDNSSNSNTLVWRDFSFGTSCSYTSGIWNIDLCDNCVISSQVTGDGSNLIINESSDCDGSLTLTANVLNFSDIIMSSTDSSNKANIYCVGGCFE